MVDWMTLAIIEMPDGSVIYCEPHELVFETNVESIRPETKP